jgi:hypothetical protein
MEAHFMNPGALPFGRGVNVGGAFQEGDMSLPTSVNNYDFEITENDPEKTLSGGIAYVTKRQSQPSYTIYDQDFSLSLAGKIFPNIGLGMQAHRLFQQNSAGPSYVKYNSTFGILAIPAQWFGLAFVVYDALGDTDQVLIPTFGIGTNFVVGEIVRIKGDVIRPELQNPNHNGIFSLGAEFILGYDLYLRVGGKWDEVANNTYASVGFGFEGPKLNVGYAYRSNVNVDGDAYHTFQTWLTF